MRRIRYEDHTWEEIREKAAQDAVIVQPIGAIEQHGPHLPLSTDTCQTNAVVARGVALAAGQIGVLLAPTIPWGFSTLQMDLPAERDRYPGTLTLSLETLLALMRELCGCFARAGFRRVALINGHGGNWQPLQCACRQVRDLTGIVVAAANWYTLPETEEMAALLVEKQLKHAGEWETALVLAADEDKVQKSKMVRDERAVAAIRTQTSYVSRDELGGRQFATKAMVAERNTDFAVRGVVGDPTPATREQGEKLLDLHARALAKFLIEFSTWEYGRL